MIGFRTLRFLRTPLQFSKCAAGKAAELGRSRVKLLGVIGAARIECGEPTAETRELIRRQFGNSFGDFFDFHVPQYSTRGLIERRRGDRAPAPVARLLAQSGMPRMT